MRPSCSASGSGQQPSVSKPLLFGGEQLASRLKSFPSQLCFLIERERITEYDCYIVHLDMWVSWLRRTYLLSRCWPIFHSVIQYEFFRRRFPPIQLFPLSTSLSDMVQLSACSLCNSAPRDEFEFRLQMCVQLLCRLPLPDISS